MSDIRKVAVLGTGVLGSQIAFQTAYSGFDVVAYDISEEALEQARARLAALVETYTNEVSGAAGGKAAGALKRIALLSDLGAAVADADLVIEAVPEVLSIKQALYEKLAGLAPDRTIFATNSSTLLPSDLKAYTGRPDRFLALHFANSIWKFNTAEAARMRFVNQSRKTFRFRIEGAMIGRCGARKIVSAYCENSIATIRSTSSRSTVAVFRPLLT